MNTLYTQTPAGTFAEADVATVRQTAEEQALAEIARRGPELNPESLKALVPSLFGGRDHEFMAVAFLDPQFRLIEFKVMAEGGLVQVELPHRELVKEALRVGAFGIVIMHNHPSSQQARPSDGDRKATRDLLQALGFIDLHLVDHWVITAKEVYSFKDHGDLRAQGAGGRRIAADGEDIGALLSKILGGHIDD